MSFCFILAAQTYTWKSVTVHGMGFVTGIIAHPLDQNLVYAKTDVGGLYRWEASNSAWVPLLDGKGIGLSIESFAISPANPSLIYIATDSSIYKSADQGNTWARQSLPVFMDGNGEWRQAGERLAVDPNGNGAVVYFGSRKNGLWKSSNSGSTWAQISIVSIPVGADAGVSFVAFDKASGNATTASSKIYAGVMGSGIYQTSNGGTSWELIPGGPATSLRPIGASIGTNGKVYVAYAGTAIGGPGAVYVFDGASLSAITPSNTAGSGFCGISVDPSNPLRIITAEFNAGPQKTLHLSNDGGVSWIELPFNNGSQSMAGLKNVTEPPYYPT
ncbi:MAG: hypothetical protein M3Y08_11335 [Fibrobacterota bacterium]|nr:hypothetical protein [Fibrobacterota bacterium]